MWHLCLSHCKGYLLMVWHVWLWEIHHLWWQTFDGSNWSGCMPWIGGSVCLLPLGYGHYSVGWIVVPEVSATGGCIWWWCYHALGNFWRCTQGPYGVGLRLRLVTHSVHRLQLVHLCLFDCNKLKLDSAKKDRYFDCMKSQTITEFINLSLM